ncbi:MAG TPA: glycosyltransferase, partial [Thermodesulfovibrionia bacterium]|nr:glycosyltransferase [Thermodesulfovibrionia bacterium]
MKVLISGGGTGGHIFPALAIAQNFLQHGLAHDEILFVGTKHGIESRVVPEAGFTLE